MSLRKVWTKLNGLLEFVRRHFVPLLEPVELSQFEMELRLVRVEFDRLRQEQSSLWIVLLSEEKITQIVIG